MDVKAQIADTVEPHTQSDGESWAGFFWFLIRLVLFVIAFRILLFSPFSIPSESMLPRLMNGDYLLAAKWPYGYSKNSLFFETGLPEGRLFASDPKRGDLVIFKHPVDRTDYIKRVIGIPGDTVALVDGKVTLNGQFLPKTSLGDFDVAVSGNTFCSWGSEEILSQNGEGVCRYQRFRETLPGGKTYEVFDFGMTHADTFSPITIPTGHMFVMGDNRDNSRDSRFPAAAGDGVGIVQQDQLVGKAMLIVWSTDGDAEWIKPWTWFSSARWDRIGDLL